MDDEAGLHGDGLLDVAGGVAADGVWGVDDFHFDGGGELELYGFIVDEEDVVAGVFDEEVFLVFIDEVLGEDDVLEGFGVHEVVALFVEVGVLEFLGFRVAEFDGFGGADLGGSGGAGDEVSEDELDEAGLSALRSVFHFEDQAGLALIH